MKRNINNKYFVSYIDCNSPQLLTLYELTRNEQYNRTSGLNINMAALLVGGVELSVDLGPVRA